jgi:hypothetical protein
MSRPTDLELLYYEKVFQNRRFGSMCFHDVSMNRVSQVTGEQSLNRSTVNIFPIADSTSVPARRLGSFVAERNDSARLAGPRHLNFAFSRPSALPGPHKEKFLKFIFLQCGRDPPA